MKLFIGCALLAMFAYNSLNLASNGGLMVYSAAYAAGALIGLASLFVGGVWLIACEDSPKD